MDGSKRILITNGKIYGEGQVFDPGYIVIDNERIGEIGKYKDDHYKNLGKKIRLTPEYQIIPGFIDVHMHGLGGVDTMDGTRESLSKICGFLPAEGTTSFLATTLTADESAISKAVEAVSEYMKADKVTGTAEILGIHLEGPFISPDQCGAQSIQCIKKPDVNLFKIWQTRAENNIKLVTLAPELDNDYELITYLKSTGVIPSIGHSHGTYQESMDSFRKGVSHVTHLFNAMRGVHHREPGVVGAALMDKEVIVEIIVDGIHVAPVMVEFAFGFKGVNNIVLVTDSMCAKGTKENGIFYLGNQKVIVKEGRTYLGGEDKLAGSVLRMIDAVKNMMKYTELCLDDVIKMVSVNPAKELGVYQKKGSLAVGKDADMVILDDKNEIVMTLCRGKIAYVNESLARPLLV